jgi:hypothetical protein
MNMRIFANWISYRNPFWARKFNKLDCLLNSYLMQKAKLPMQCYSVWPLQNLDTKIYWSISWKDVLKNELKSM